MPYDVQVIPISEFLRADVAGTLEPGASRVFLKELLRVAEEKNTHHILIDCREAASRSTPTDILALVKPQTSHRVSQPSER